MADKPVSNYVAIGDSLAVGMMSSNKLDGQGRVGAGPDEVLRMIREYAKTKGLSGKTVFLGTGLPNIPNQASKIADQIRVVKESGGTPVLIGTGPGTEKRPTTGQNDILAKLAKDNNVQFTGPLESLYPGMRKADPMGLHLRNNQYKDLFQRYAPATRTAPATAQTTSQPQSRAAPQFDMNALIATVMQAESRGKRYGKDGKLLTSPKGAMGEMQVMPKTITDPGFGVKPAKDSSPDEIARVGRDYLTTMVNRYGGDVDAALVAYNWGPGNADKWVKRGKDFGSLPKETQKYVTFIQGKLGGKPGGKPPQAIPERAKTPVTQPQPQPQPQKQSQPQPQKQPQKQPSLKRVESTIEEGPDMKLSAVMDRATMEQWGPGYQAALAATTLADSREDDDDESIAEKYMNERQSADREAEDESFFSRPTALATLDLTYQSPFEEEQAPVMMAEGGEAKSMMRRLYEGAVPAQLRLFAETALMPEDKRAGSTITERDFSDEEQRQILDTIGNARRLRMDERGLTMYKDPKVIAEVQKRMKELFKDASKDSLKEFEESQRKRKAEDKYFLSGKGAVFYGDYPQDSSGRLADTTLGKSGAIRNTLGRFTYQTMPDGRISIRENYDFADDLVEGLNQRPSAEYEGMSTGQKLNALLMDTLHNPQDKILDTGTKFGKSTLPGRVGSAFIGNKGRPVDVTIDPRELMPGYAGYANGGEVGRPPVEQPSSARRALNALLQAGRAGASNLESLARGSVAGFPGMVGDVESIFRDDEVRRFPTSKEIEKKYLPKRISEPTKEASIYTDVGGFIDPFIALKAPKLVAGAAKKAFDKLGPTAAAQLERLAPAAQPMYAVRPDESKMGFTGDTGRLLNDYRVDVLANTGMRSEKFYPLRDMVEKKAKDYYIKQFGTANDPLRKAVIQGELPLFSLSNIDQYAKFMKEGSGTGMASLIKAAKSGDKKARAALEKAYDEMTGLTGFVTDAGSLEKVTKAERARMTAQQVPEELQNLNVRLGEKKSYMGSDTGKAKLYNAEETIRPLYDMQGKTTIPFLQSDHVFAALSQLSEQKLNTLEFPQALIEGTKLLNNRLAQEGKRSTSIYPKK